MRKGAPRAAFHTACHGTWLGLAKAIIAVATVGLVFRGVLLRRTYQSGLTESLVHSGRRLLIREIPFEREQPVGRSQQFCNNTVSGRWLVTDDRGWVCSRDQLQFETGCCAAGDQFSCETCSLHNQCCQEFERCVSCCLAPQHRAANLSLTAFRSPDRDTTGRWSNSFEYCRGKCRTTSRSTVHENAYLDPHHHCFSPSGKPTTPSPPVPRLPDGVTLVAGEKGQSCQEACDAHAPGQLVCSAEHLPALSDCNRLRSHFACEAGCDSAVGAALENPGYVVTAAPKQQRPAMCQVDPAGSAAGTCEGLNPNMQRLCPCVQAPVPQQPDQQAQQVEQLQQDQAESV